MKSKIYLPATNENVEAICKIVLTQYNDRNSEFDDEMSLSHVFKTAIEWLKESKNEKSNSNAGRRN